ncbi:unnamed protein product [Leptidea sinapis]|uniref:Gamma-secretase-activating protein C-terminal domain-containing protein n=1 Tax=Leptidea sinapis TaxID=189913 RepID=A0A5E4QWX0_9NEOP|nr:unnamed protein product [Leptidea sinapis]
MSLVNLAVKLCGVLQSQNDEEVTAREWRLVGQEQDGSQIFTWISTRDSKDVLHIGVYTNKTKTLLNLFTFDEKLNIIQASVNSSHSLLVYVVKVISVINEDEPKYCPYLISVLPDKVTGPEPIEEEGSTKQIMLQYVYGKSNKYSPGIRNDRFILFKHLECIKIYRSPMFLNECEDGSEKWGFDGIYPEPETIVNVFSWAQWDCVNQLNIPLSLPHVPGAHGAGAACGSYEDDPVPLRVHDCSLDLYIPLEDSTSSLVLDDVDLKESGVNFAYSVTLLHHGCVVHTVVPDLPWTLAKSLRPPHHEPCCHIVMPMEASESGPSLAPLLGWGAHAMVDLNTLDVVTMNVADKDLAATFKMSRAALWRSAVSAVVLSPRQRVCQFAEDVWTRLWVALCALAAPAQRLQPAHVLDRLRVSLHCYQPEALSRCSTPMSPTAAPLPTRRPSLVAQDVFPFVELDVCTASKQEQVIAATLEQYVVSAELVAFPLPQGFSSFFTYLGYRTLGFQSFMHLVHRNVCELQIDVLKAIVASIAALPSGERLSPLDTFLDLLTAKASLNELDFNLIIEATLASVQCDAAIRS